MKLITWNIQRGRGVDGRVDMDRIVADARRFSDFDVLCVQEVSAGQRQLPGCYGSDQFEQLAARLPAYELVAGVATDVLGRGGRRRGFGNMLFSRLPVRQVFRHLLPWPVEAGVMSTQRVAIEATLDTPLGLLRVTTTHLEYYSERQRAAQIDRLRELHREAVVHARGARPGSASDGAIEPAPRAAPTVPVGDFNFKPDDPDHARLLAPMDPETPAYCDAWELANPGVHTRGRLACTTESNGQARPSPSTSSASARGSRARCPGRRRHRRVGPPADAAGTGLRPRDFVLAMETELKLLIASADVAAFRRLALLKQLATSKPATRLLRNTYLDPPELHLRENGMELRVRRVGRVATQTLKAIEQRQRPGCTSARGGRRASLVRYPNSLR